MRNRKTGDDHHQESAPERAFRRRQCARSNDETGGAILHENLPAKLWPSFCKKNVLLSRVSRHRADRSQSVPGLVQFEERKFWALEFSIPSASDAYCACP